MPTIFSGMEAMVAGSGQHKGGDCSCAHCSTAALRADPVTAPGRALHIPFHRSGKKLQQQPAALQLIVWTLQHCSTAALQLRLSTTKFREMFTIFGEYPIMIFSLLKAPTFTFTLTNLIRHNAEQMFKHGPSWDLL